MLFASRSSKQATLKMYPNTAAHYNVLEAITLGGICMQTQTLASILPAAFYSRQKHR